MSKIVITGGAGLVGSHCAEYYARASTRNEVVVLDNLARSKIFGYNQESVKFNWDYLQQYPNIKCVLGDVRNKQDVLSVLQPDTNLVIHTAGQPGVPTSEQSPLLDYSINATGTITVLDSVREICPRATVIYTSTNKIYGENVCKLDVYSDETRWRFNKHPDYKTTFSINNVPDIAINETMDLDHCGRTPYGVSKLVGDLYTQEYHYLYGLRTACFRMSCIYGHRQFGFEDQGWVAWFIVAMLKGAPITFFGDGKQVRDMLYVTDLVEAFDMFYQSNLKHAVFNIGGGLNNTISLVELIEMLKVKLLKTPEIIYSDWRPADQKVYISDISKVYKKLGWLPTIGVKIGVYKLIDWIKSNWQYFE